MFARKRKLLERETIFVEDLSQVLAVSRVLLADNCKGAGKLDVYQRNVILNAAKDRQLTGQDNRSLNSTYPFALGRPSGHGSEDFNCITRP
ncbi:hypothetical protein L3X38_029708 [Prunus dulcis]|uniref:Uncharacterized protein n=1 Tax=Prunus dulcis TaxID=3755 RepID=A0AAD4Z2E5_PRUDU|nr:hypothetical protein L3X38_029708 [Prunus dulcis]